jgi:hypothetical protein
MTDGKICTKCKVFKSFGEFYRHKEKKDGFRSNCKSCVKEYDKGYYVGNADKIKLYYKEYRAANPDKRKLYHKERYQKNKVEIRAKHTKYMRTRRHTDEAFNLLSKLRSRLHKVLNGTRKSKSTMKLIGMESSEDILKYLYEKSPRFEGVPLSELHVDHIIPCAAFDMLSVDHQRVCFHYTNLQLLTPAENLSKNDSVPPGFDVDDYVKKHLPRGNSSFFSSAILPLP